MTQLHLASFVSSWCFTLPLKVSFSKHYLYACSLDVSNVWFWWKWDWLLEIVWRWHPLLEGLSIAGTCLLSHHITSHWIKWGKKKGVSAVFFYRMSLLTTEWMMSLLPRKVRRLWLGASCTDLWIWLLWQERRYESDFHQPDQSDFWELCINVLSLMFLSVLSYRLPV